MGKSIDDIYEKYEKRADRILEKYGLSDKVKFPLGKNSITGRNITLNESEFKKHWHILGATGKGKTKYIEHIVRTLIKNKQGLCLIDPHGDLYKALLDYVVRHRLEKKVILIDPDRDDCLFGLNFFERGEHISKDTHAQVQMIMQAIAKVFGGEDQDTMPRLQRWGKNVIHALMEHNLTMVEMLDFMSLENPEIRKRLVEGLNDPYIKIEWEGFEGIRKSEQEIKLESVLNRAAKFVGDQRIRRIVGQAKSTINFRKAMDEGKIVLVNLSALKMSRESQRMLGVMITNLVVEAAYSRGELPERKRKPFYFIIDEFGEFVTDDFAYALESLRKYGIFLMPSNQQMDQLEQESSRVYHSVMTNCTNKVIFGISREDAEVMAKEIFTGMIRGDIIKDVIEQTKFWPIKTREKVYGYGKSTSHGSGTMEGSAKGSGISSGQSVGSGKVDVFGPDGPAIFMDAMSHSLSSMDTNVSMSSNSSVSSQGSSESWGESESFSEADTPWYDYQPFREVSSRSYYSIQEQLEKFISWIKNQSVRQAQVKIDTNKPVPMLTPNIEDKRVRPIDVERFDKAINSLYARPVDKIDKEIEDRREKLLKGSENDTEPEDFRE